MKKKVVIITATLSPETLEIKDKEIEEVIRLYLNPSDIPFCESIEKVTVLSES